MRMNLSSQNLLMFTPLPPMPTGIADYAYELLDELRQYDNCTVVIDDGNRQVFAPPGVTVISAAEYINAQRHRSDLHIYQLGNNPDHVYMLPFIVQRPGIVVLHDPSLHHLMDHVTVVLGDFDRYVAAIEAEHGAAGRLLAEQFHRYR